MRTKTLIIPLALVGLTFALVATSQGQKPDPETARIVRGLQIAPVARWRLISASERAFSSSESPFAAAI